MTRKKGSDGASDNLSQDNETFENDLGKARDSIRSERIVRDTAEPRQRGEGLTRFKETFVFTCTLITSIVAVGGFGFAIFQFDKTMKAERYASAEAVVSQFISQVTELKTQENLAHANASAASGYSNQKNSQVSDEKTQSFSLLDSFIVSRAQMLIDGEETGRFTGDILRFFAANQYGHYIGKHPFRPRPSVTIAGLVLVDSKLSQPIVENQTTVENVFLHCVGFDHGVFENLTFIGGGFDHVFLNSKSRLLSVDFSNSKLTAVVFNDTSFSGKIKFDKARLLSVSFSGSMLREPSTMSFEGADIINSDLTNIVFPNPDNTQEAAEESSSVLTKLLSLFSNDVSTSVNVQNDNEQFYNDLAGKLSKANSLWGTQFDEKLMEKLKKILNKNEISNYDKIVNTAPDWVTGNENIDRSWEGGGCPEKQRRDRRFDSTLGDSLNVVQALF